MIDDEFKKDAEESRIARWGFAAINACLRIRFRIGDAVTVAKGRLALLASEMERIRDRVCWQCRQYGFRPGNPKGWRWACCFKKGFWFPEAEDKPGERKGCEEWQ